MRLSGIEIHVIAKSSKYDFYTLLTLLKTNNIILIIKYLFKLYNIFSHYN